jgi:hypothetical protein
MTAGDFLLWVTILAGASGVLAGDPPPEVPNPLGPAAKYIGANMFTTKAYQDEAFRLVLQEANQVAKELQLPEKFPIADADLVGRFINPFGYARVKKAIGNVTTRNYAYYVSQGNKFSYLEGTHQDEDCRRFQRLYTWPASRIDTNQAYQLATQWLIAVSMDVGALNRECSVVVRPERDYVHPPQGKFVPVYYVYWRKVGTDGGAAADVRVFTPTKTLLQLRVEDPKYILRAPLLFTNLQYLLSRTNAALVPSMRLGGYVGKTGNSDYKPFYFNQALMTTDIEFSEENFLVTKETADAYLKTKAVSAPPATPPKPGEPAHHQACPRFPFGDGDAEEFTRTFLVKERNLSAEQRSEARGPPRPSGICNMAAECPGAPSFLR